MDFLNFFRTSGPADSCQSSSMSSCEQYPNIDIEHFGENLQMANLLMEGGQGKRASICYQNAIRINPQSATAHFGLMLAVFRYANDTQTAITYLESELRIDPDSFTYLTQLAILQFWHYEDKKAINLEVNI